MSRKKRKKNYESIPQSMEVPKFDKLFHNQV